MDYHKKINDTTDDLQVKIVVSPIGEWIGGVLSLKLPFTLLHTKPDSDNSGSPSPPATPSRILDKIETLDDSNEDSLPFIDKDTTSDEEQNDSLGKKSDEDEHPPPDNNDNNKPSIDDKLG